MLKFDLVTIALAIFTITFFSCPLSAAGTYAIAIHGGIGSSCKNMSAEERLPYRKALSQILARGRTALALGRPSIEVVESVVRDLEDNPLFNAGKGAVFTHDGTHELDASIMDGSTLACGAVTGVHSVKNPITLARLVMTKSRHVFLSSTGAELFARKMKVKLVNSDYFFVQDSYDSWRQRLLSNKEKPGGGTVGCVALDKQGNLAAATSTGGMTDKRFGRIGDSPVIGAGTYAHNATCAVSCTGHGEEFIRHTVSRSVSAVMEYGKKSLASAVKHVLFEKLAPNTGGLISVSHTGKIVMSSNTPTLLRGAADHTGYFEVGIFLSKRQ